MIAIALLVAGLPVLAAQKTFDATYVATISNVPSGLKELRVWIPLPTTRGWQKISELQILSPYVWIRKTDPDFGNDYAFTTIANPAGGDVTVRVRFKAARTEANSATPAETDLKRAFRGDRLVKVTADMKKVAQEVTLGIKKPFDQARAIYEHVVSTTKGGDCAEFQTQFLGLSRAKGIAARFVGGFTPKAPTHECWAEVFVSRMGWIPVTPTAFGSLDADRVELTVGRGVNLDPRPSESIEYFLYPRAEAGGKPVGDPSATVQFRGK